MGGIGMRKGTRFIFVLARGGAAGFRHLRLERSPRAPAESGPAEARVEAAPSLSCCSRVAELDRWDAAPRSERNVLRGDHGDRQATRAGGLPPVRNGALSSALGCTCPSSRWSSSDTRPWTTSPVCRTGAGSSRWGSTSSWWRQDPVLRRTAVGRRRWSQARERRARPRGRGLPAEGDRRRAPGDDPRIRHRGAGSAATSSACS